LLPKNRVKNDVFEFSGRITNNAKSSSDFAICYTSRSSTVKFGFISKFLKIETKTFFISNLNNSIIQIAYKKRSLTNDNELNDILEKFFLIGHLSNEYEIINKKQILTKSSILQHNKCEEIFI
jgi:hypothetical protein